MANLTISNFFRTTRGYKKRTFSCVYNYYDNGLKMDIDTFSQEAGDEVKTIPLIPGEPTEFSYHKYAPFDEKYSLTIDDIRFGITLDV